MFSKRSRVCNILCLALITSLFGCTSVTNSRKRPASANDRTRSRTKNDIAEDAQTNTLKRRGEWNLSSEKVKVVAPLVSNAAKEYNLPADLIFGMIWVESRFDPHAVSPVGARGLMQLMPRTAEYLATKMSWDGHDNPFDPEFNIAAGTYYIARLLTEFNGDENVALAAYNAGPGKVRRWLENSGLPRISIEYATMVQTARSFFKSNLNSDARAAPFMPNVTDGDLDRLGLTILIAGLSNNQFRLERDDDPNPFDE